MHQQGYAPAAGWVSKSRSKSGHVFFDSSLVKYFGTCDGCESGAFMYAYILMTIPHGSRAIKSLGSSDGHMLTQNAVHSIGGCNTINLLVRSVLDEEALFDRHGAAML